MLTRLKRGFGYNFLTLFLVGSGAKIIEEDSDPEEVEAARSGKTHCDTFLFVSKC